VRCQLRQGASGYGKSTRTLVHARLSSEDA
jgi:hypothetical protein